MISGISSMGNTMQMMRSSGMQGTPPPKGQDVFQVADSNGDGLVSKSELQVVTKGIEKITGNTINVDETLNSFDANQDGGLSGEEMLQMLTSQGFAPPSMTSGEGASGMKPPPPPPPSQGQEVSLVGDTNGDGVLSLAELEALSSSEGSGSDLKTSSSSSFEQALSSYEQNSGESKIAQLTGLLLNQV